MTVTWTVPLPAGATATMMLSDTTVKDVAAVAANLTAVAPVKWVPVRVTAVLPALGPWVGLTALRVGAARVAGFCGVLGLFNTDLLADGPRQGGAGSYRRGGVRRGRGGRRRLCPGGVLGRSPVASGLRCGDQMPGTAT